MGLLKKLLIFVFILIVTAGAVLWLYQYEIVKYSAEKAIRAALPEYVRVDRIIVDPRSGELAAEGLSLLNPPGFHNRYMATVDRVGCRLRTRGKNVLSMIRSMLQNGIEITDARAEGPHINIERLADGSVNLREFHKLASPAKSPANGSSADESSAAGDTPGAGFFKGEDIAAKVEFPSGIKITGGKITFMDKKVSRRGYVLSFEDVNGDVTVNMSENNTFVRKIGSEGSGNVNGDSGQTVNWRISWEPLTTRLTLSSRFRVDMVDIMPFKPYYDRYSPVNVHQGWMSGTLVFDFDNGNIGSTNEIRLYRLKFSKRTGGRVSDFWSVAVSDIVQYLRTARDEVTFDFRIKGDMDSPTIYPGPHVKKAIRAYAFDTIDQLVSGGEEKAGDTGKDVPDGDASPSGDRSDAEKVVDIIRELMKSRQ